MSDKALKFEKVNIKWKILVLGIFLVFQAIGLIINLVYGFPSDFDYYYRDVKHFWMGSDIYETGFFYLYYFYYLFAWIAFLPRVVSLFIFLFLSDLILWYIVSSIEDRREMYWALGNLPFGFYFSVAFNVNIIIAFSFILFQKTRKKWYAPIFLLLGFYKVTPIAVFFFIFGINWYFEKFRNVDKKQILTYIFITLILIHSFFMSFTQIDNNLTQFGRFCPLIQLPHFFWISYPLNLFIRNKEYSLRKVMYFWYYIYNIFLTFFLITWGFSCWEVYIEKTLKPPETFMKLSPKPIREISAF